MKVLYITNYDTMGGANHCLCEMSLYMQRYHNVEPYILVPSGGTIEAKLKPYGIKFIFHTFRISAVDENIKYKPFRKLTRKIMRYKEFYAVLDMIDRQGLTFDLVHTNTSITDIGLFLAKKWGVPHVWHFREILKDGYPLEYVWGKREFTQKLLQSSQIITISEALAKRIEGYSLKINNIQIYDGVEIRPPYVKKYCEGGIVHFCMVGMIYGQKNQMDAVKACKVLVSRGYTDFSLTIIGPTQGDYYHKILNYIKEAQLNPYICFTGYQSDVGSVLEHMDVGIMATNNEAFGRVTVEYMSNYMPVIGARSGATPELVSFMNLLYEVKHIEELANRMIYCIDHRNEMQNIGRQARKVSETYTVKNNCEQIWAVYQEILKNKQDFANNR